MKSLKQIFYVAWRLFRIPLIAVMVLGSTSGVLSAASVYMVFNNQVPVDVPDSPVEFVESSPSTVYDVNGDLIATFRPFNLFTPVEYEDIPDSVLNAVISSEDRRFWEHNGADPEGILRAMYQVWKADGEKTQGGSTITQQVARGLYLTNEKSYERKVREILLAIQLEQVITKEDILEVYLNMAYFGEGAYGVAAAAEVYFGKPLSEITNSEAASLVGSIPAPSYYNPRESPELNDGRRIVILGKMYLEGYITSDEYLEAKKLTIYNVEDDGWVPRYSTVVVQPQKTFYGEFPYFVDSVRREILETFGEETLFSGGLKIYTTLDPKIQSLAIEKSKEYITGGGAEGVQSSIVMIENDTGYIQAMVGGWDWETSQNNLALGSSLGFQPGSSLKPFIYAQALESGLLPTSSIAAPASWTVPECNSGQCTVSGGPKGVTVTNLETAIKFSYNTPFVILSYEMGTNNTADYMKAAGVDLRQSNNYSPTLALGAYEVSPLGLASGYSTLARDGSQIDATAIIRIVKDDEILVDNSSRNGNQIINAGVARYTTEALFAVTEGGTGRSVSLTGGRVAGKTGTSSSYKAAWFAGYTPKFTTVVWVGNPDIPTALSNINGFGNIGGGTLPAKIWREFMKEFLGDSVWEFSELPPYPELEDDGKISATTTTSTTAPIEPGGSKTIKEEEIDCIDKCAVYPTLPDQQQNTTTTVPTTTSTTNSPIVVTTNTTTTSTIPEQQTFFTLPES